MAKQETKTAIRDLKALFEVEDGDFMKNLVRTVLQEVLEAEMDETVNAAKGVRSEGRLGYRSGYYQRKLITRVGTIELRVPQDRQGRFSTEVFERYSRSEKALVSALSEMYVQGVSTRKVKAVTEELCGHEFSASTVSVINKRLDDEIKAFFSRRLTEDCPYLILDARYERIREHGTITKQAVLVAIGIGWDGRRSILGIELADRESGSSWRDFLVSLKQRGLAGVEFVVSDSHEGLKKAVCEVLPAALWQRCYVHFLRNAWDHLPRKGDDDCLKELRWVYERRTRKEAEADLTAWLTKWESKYPKLTDWVEENIGETFSFYRLPQPHRKHMKSTNMIERFNEEIRRRTYVVRIFPNAASCLRLIRALAIETHEDWIEQSRYLSMDLLKEHKKEEFKKEREAA